MDAGSPQAARRRQARAAPHFPAAYQYKAEGRYGKREPVGWRPGGGEVRRAALPEIFPGYGKKKGGPQAPQEVSVLSARRAGAAGYAAGLASAGAAAVRENSMMAMGALSPLRRVASLSTRV